MNRCQAATGKGRRDLDRNGCCNALPAPLSCEAQFRPLQDRYTHLGCPIQNHFVGQEGPTTTGSASGFFVDSDGGGARDCHDELVPGLEVFKIFRISGPHFFD